MALVSMFLCNQSYASHGRDFLLGATILNFNGEGAVVDCRHHPHQGSSQPSRRQRPNTPKPKRVFEVARRCDEETVPRNIFSATQKILTKTGGSQRLGPNGSRNLGIKAIGGIPFMGVHPSWITELKKVERRREENKRIEMDSFPSTE